MANYIYYITAAGKSIDMARIANVSLHVKDSSGIHDGILKSRNDIVNMLANKNNIIYTATWDYTHNQWKQGARVVIDEKPTGLFIKTVSDSTVRDNLENLPPTRHIA